MMMMMMMMMMMIKTWAFPSNVTVRSFPSELSSCGPVPSLLLYVHYVYIGVYAYFCFPCFTCTLASEMNECACGPLCFNRLFVVAMRTKVRTMYGIRVSQHS